jgi:AcrR family transcriptional regulator
MAPGSVPTSEAETAMTEPSRRARRHQATKARILEAAWDIARTEGLAGIALRDLAARVDLSQSSLYSYFDSKHALYDAMFADGYRQLIKEVGHIELDAEPRRAFKQVAHFMIRVSSEDVPRYQLLFTRTIPGFEPSAESYALAVDFLQEGRRRAAAAGLTEDRDFDLYTALVAGLSSQQLANEPGGDRWLRLLDEALDLLLDHAAGRTAGARTAKTRSEGGR